MAIVILVQTYIIWIQVEIGLRQTVVFQQEFEPSFKPKVDFKLLGDSHYVTVHVENVGEYPAYNVMVEFVDGITRNPLEKGGMSESPKTLAPKDSMAILQIPSSEFHDMPIEMNALYKNMSNEDGQVTFIKFPKSNDFMLIHTPLNVRQGILVKSLENLNVAYRALR